MSRNDYHLNSLTLGGKNPNQISSSSCALCSREDCFGMVLQPTLSFVFTMLAAKLNPVHLLTLSTSVRLWTSCSFCVLLFLPPMWFSDVSTMILNMTEKCSYLVLIFPLFLSSIIRSSLVWNTLFYMSALFCIKHYLKRHVAEPLCFIIIVQQNNSLPAFLISIHQ